MKHCTLAKRECNPAFNHCNYLITLPLETSTSLRLIKNKLTYKKHITRQKGFIDQSLSKALSQLSYFNSFRVFTWTPFTLCITFFGLSLSF